MDAILWLEDGTKWPGRLLGSPKNGFGEAVFTTSMTGYQELLTDPSYCGQILVFTSAHIGNVGINREDFESSQVWPSAMVTQDVPRLPSNWRSTQSLPHWFPVPLLTRCRYPRTCAASAQSRRHACSGHQRSKPGNLGRPASLPHHGRPKSDRESDLQRANHFPRSG